jgi:membrane protease YdiL (CAAX protease family)
LGELGADPQPLLERLGAAVKGVVPVPGLLLVLPALWLMFRKTWLAIDRQSQEERAALLAEGKTDLRPLVALPLCALILTLQEYYGGRAYFDTVLRPLILDYDASHHGFFRFVKFDELYGFGWWAGTRILGYVFVPFVVWKTVFPKDSLLDMGLRTKGFFAHVWIYGLFLAVVIPAMLIVSREPDFGGYYPFYKQSSRSWLDFLLWEAMYFGQFFALEVFFRGFWLGALRRQMGSGAIFAMCVPYCMIHYGKPYLEANGAIVAGIALGSLSMKTKSIYQGFLVHITVAGLMDWLALSHRNALPKQFWPPPQDLAVPPTWLAPEASATARAHASVWGTVLALMVLALLVRLVVDRVRASRAAAPQATPPKVA